MPGSRNAQKANYKEVMYLTKITFEVHKNKYKRSCCAPCIAASKPRGVSTLTSRVTSRHIKMHNSQASRFRYR